MKYISLLKTEEGLKPLKLLNFDGYIYKSALLYHDIFSHRSNYEDGSVAKELLAQGHELLSSDNYYTQLSEVLNILSSRMNENNIKAIKRKPLNRYFKEIIHYNELKALEVLDEVKFNIALEGLCYGYYNAKKRISWDLDIYRMLDFFEELYNIQFKVGTVIKLPIIMLQHLSKIEFHEYVAICLSLRGLAIPNKKIIVLNLIDEKV